MQNPGDEWLQTQSSPSTFSEDCCCSCRIYQEIIHIFIKEIKSEEPSCRGWEFPAVTWLQRGDSARWLLWNHQRLRDDLQKHLVNGSAPLRNWDCSLLEVRVSSGWRTLMHQLLVKRHFLEGNSPQHDAATTATLHPSRWSRFQLFGSGAAYTVKN